MNVKTASLCYASLVVLLVSGALGASGKEVQRDASERLVYEVDRDWWRQLPEDVRNYFLEGGLVAVARVRLDPDNKLEFGIRLLDGSPPRIEITLPKKDVPLAHTLLNQTGLIEIRVAASAKDTDANDREVGRTVFDAVRAAGKDFKATNGMSVPPLPKELPKLKGSNELAWAVLSKSQMRDVQEQEAV
jgi:hypothetical protein